MHLLYVEDNPHDADLVRRALARLAPAMVLETAGTLAQALQRLQQAPLPAVLLADLHLPDGSGMALLQQVRTQRLPLAVVVLTGQGDEQHAVAALKAGADDYLPKTDGFEARLPGTLRAALARFQAGATRPGQMLRVLYAEGDALDLDLTRRHLACHALNITLHTVRDGAAVLARLPEAPAPLGVDVLLLDHRLGNDTALDLLQQLRTERRLDLPVVLVTGQGSEDLAASAMRLGATDYLVKREGYLQALPAVLENAYHRVAVAREHAELRRVEHQIREVNAGLEQRVVERTQELAQANRELEAFSYSVSHDLRAPLRAVDALSAMLALDHADALGPEGRRKLQLLRSSTARMDRLISDLLDFARTARQAPKRVPVPLAALVRHCVDEFRAEITQRGIEVAVGPLPDCEADPMLLRQLLLNLLGNAVKYTRRQAAPRIAVSAAQDGGEVVYTVADNGTGFDMKHAGKLFQVFHRLHDDAAFEGTGVGLAIVARIVQRHGGRVWAEAAPGEGARFSFTLGAA